MASIGERIKALMAQQRLSTKELAQAANVPVSTISQWLLYKQMPKPEALLRVARTLGVTMEFLVSGEHPEQVVAQGFIEALEKRFIDLHDGVYRVRIQKQVELPPRSGSRTGRKGVVDDKGSK